MNFGKLMRIETPEEADVKFAELKAAGYKSLQIIYTMFPPVPLSKLLLRSTVW